MLTACTLCDESAGIGSYVLAVATHWRVNQDLGNQLEPAAEHKRGLQVKCGNYHSPVRLGQPRMQMAATYGFALAV